MLPIVSKFSIIKHSTVNLKVNYYSEGIIYFGLVKE